jgi:hypothetical protein
MTEIWTCECGKSKIEMTPAEHRLAEIIELVCKFCHTRLNAFNTNNRKHCKKCGAEFTGEEFIYQQSGYCSNDCRFDKVRE